MAAKWALCELDSFELGAGLQATHADCPSKQVLLAHWQMSKRMIAGAAKPASHLSITISYALRFLHNSALTFLKQCDLFHVVIMDERQCVKCTTEGFVLGIKPSIESTACEGQSEVLEMLMHLLCHTIPSSLNLGSPPQKYFAVRKHEFPAQRSVNVWICLERCWLFAGAANTAVFGNHDQQGAEAAACLPAESSQGGGGR